MCGINGIVELKRNDKLNHCLSSMNDAIIHRGPDDDGVYMEDERIALGMRRLSIIDLSNGKQPILSEDENLVITFNGEIYNYLDLKKDLLKQGISFKTDSDTEVVLKLYELYSENCLGYLNGMFVFAIFDKKNNTIFIARDRFGEKPLYYSFSKDRILWASELKSLFATDYILKKINPESLNLYLTLSYIPAPLTIYESVYKLQAGHYMVINSNKLDFTIRKYWDSMPSNSQEHINYENAKKSVRNILFDSVEKRMISDVPLGVFLSGGVDSSIIAAIMAKISNKPIKTFSVGYNEKEFDESDRAKLVASHIGSEHHEYKLDYNEILTFLDDVILNYDEPFADSSSLPTYFISKETVKYVKVALTGDGGDEVFAGYNKYLIHTYGAVYDRYVPHFLKKYLIQPLMNSKYFKNGNTKSLGNKIKRLVTSISDNLLTNHLNIISLGFNSHERFSLLKNNYLDSHAILVEKMNLNYNSSTDSIKMARYIDKQTSLEGDMLVKVDRASMLASLECRSPYLDHRLFEFTNQIPDNYLLKGSNQKRILKDTFEDLLPESFFNAPKSGFEIPISTWFKNELKIDLINTLKIENLIKHNYFNIDYVSLLIKNHLENKEDNSFKLWILFCFQKWYNVNF